MSFRKIQTSNLVSVDTSFDDPLIVLNASSNISTDIGFLGRIGNDLYAGLVKDSSTNSFILIESITLNDNTVNDINALDASLTKATLEVGALNVNGQAVATESYVNSQLGISSGEFVLPVGETSARPVSPVSGQMFFNSDTNMFEGYDGTKWVQFVPSEYNVLP